MKYNANKKLIIQKIDKDLVIFDSDRSYLFTFNETAEYIFKKVKLGWEEDKIVLMLEKKYMVKKEIIKKDLKVLIKDMLKNRIILLQ